MTVIEFIETLEKIPEEFKVLPVVDRFGHPIFGCRVEKNLEEFVIVE